jgi:hypothetical protein
MISTNVSGLIRNDLRRCQKHPSAARLVSAAPGRSHRGEPHPGAELGTWAQPGDRPRGTAYPHPWHGARCMAHSVVGDDELQGLVPQPRIPQPCIHPHRPATDILGQKVVRVMQEPASSPKSFLVDHPAVWRSLVPYPPHGAAVVPMEQRGKADCLVARIVDDIDPLDAA